jgi:protoporphyrin/coproporphyrin ferrochelatase
MEKVYFPTSEVVPVLVMSYGTPENMDQIADYYTHIRKGRPPAPEQLQDLTDRYARIGGTFPLRQNTNRQVQALEDHLNAMDTGLKFKCYQGLKHVAPFVEDGVAEIAKTGSKRALGIVLAPHFSTYSVANYVKRAKEEASTHGIEMHCVESYHVHPWLLTTLAQRVNKQLDAFEAEGVSRADVRVIFSAHSLPERIVEMGDPYPQQLNETATKVAALCDVTNWQFAWQSAGQNGMVWLGPDIQDVLRTIATEDGVKYALICPIGFVSDHLEVLFDIDIECQTVAAEVGISLKRTDSLNTDPAFIATLADVLVQLLPETLGLEEQTIE